MTNEILIGVCGLVLSVRTYFAGVWCTERRHDKEDREARVLSHQASRWSHPRQ